jgi:hypothetical protein
MKVQFKFNKEIIAEVDASPLDEFSLECVQSDSAKAKKFFEHEIATFEVFRKSYPGVKRGLDTEFANFRKKTKEWKEELPKLYASVLLEKEYKDKAKFRGEFVPQWKNLQTWINNRCWEIEYGSSAATPTLGRTVTFQTE